MKTKLLPFVLCFFIAYGSTAQHTDKVEADGFATGALHNGLDEIVHPDGSVKSEASVSGLVKHIPLSKNSNHSYSRYKTGNNSSLLTASSTESGKEVYSVELRRNKMHGRWVSRHSNGQLLDSGTLNKNIPDGEWLSWYSNGQVRSVRNYSASKWFMVQNQIYRYNPKTTTNPLARMAVKRDGSFEAVTQSTHSFSDLAAGDKYTPPFVHCLPHGLYMNYYSNGAIKDSGLYKDGMRDGLWNEHFENGQLNTSGSYFKGQKHGGWKSYNNKGKLITLAEYQQGRLVHRKNY